MPVRRRSIARRMSPYLILDRYTDEAYFWFLDIHTDRDREADKVLAAQSREVRTLGRYTDHSKSVVEVDSVLLQDMFQKNIPVACFHRAIQAYRAKKAYENMLKPRGMNDVSIFMPWHNPWDSLTACQQQNTIMYYVRQKPAHEYVRTEEEYWWCRDDHFLVDELIFEQYKANPAQYFMEVHDTIDFDRMHRDMREFVRIRFRDEYTRFDASWLGCICAFRCANSNKIEFYWDGIAKPGAKPGVADVLSAKRTSRRMY